MKNLSALLLVLSLLLCACSGPAAPGASSNPAPSAPASSTASLPHLKHVVITIRNYGEIKLELDASAAPITVENFIQLARQGFYDGLTFHRIMDGFMIQGGAPKSGSSAPPSIKGEFAANGVKNPILHKAGVISMARTNNPDSAASQFFITVAAAHHLDGNYAAFGYVTEGLEIAQKIARDARPVDNNGTILPNQQPIIESIRVLD